MNNELPRGKPRGITERNPQERRSKLRGISIPRKRDKSARIALLSLLAALLLLAGGYVVLAGRILPSATAIEYRNTNFGFRFALPAGWKGFSMVMDQWQGYTSGDQGDVLAEHGPLISIRHPLWTSLAPRQDIPIMVFTLAQWDSLQRDEFHIGAAPIGPSELGRNARYVFALPARYNFAYLNGWEEVQNIIDGHPLHTF
jgi:hypothetical protein